MRIAETPNDFRALLENVKGKQRPDRTTVIGAALLAFLFGILMPALVLLAIWVDEDPAPRPWVFAVLILFVAGCPFAAIEIFLAKASRYVAGSDGFARQSPLPFGSWRTPLRELEFIDFDPGQYGLAPMLRIRALGRKRVFPLKGECLETFLRLYPELKPTDWSRPVPRWMGVLAYGALGSMLIAVLVFIAWLWSNGLLF